MKIKQGDTVRILTGKDKGKEGKVLQVFPGHNRLVVEDINLAVRHLGTRTGEAKGQKITFPSPINVSNVALVSNGKSGRVGYKMLEKSGKTSKVRVVRKGGSVEEVE